MSRFATAPNPIRSLLVANRGEIAVRVIRTARALGLRTVAVYSDADAGAPHVRAADEAVRIGPASAAESYLSIAAILAAARATGADAIHPGYGFLSENAGFVRACDAAGITFVGPSADAVAAMGSKIAAKRIAAEHGVPTVPGYHGDDQSPETLAREAERIGYPVLIKASAGGGGRGMRAVHKAEDFASALSAAQAEATSAFGDGSVLLERFIGRPRHLEVQVVGDAHGNIVHLFERDCSVQRNNQKVIEEAPAPNLTPAAREALQDAALRLARAIGYTSAGTVEFIMEEGSAEPFFLEMNTRLQVEHPVTEEITGVDLVEWQLTVAAGLPLPLAQAQIHAKGHAIEVRLAAERADQGFAPAIGRFVRVGPAEGIRLDTGIADGSEVGLHYDSMLAKAIAWAPTRAEAVARLSAGLARLPVLGTPTNQAFLKDCLARPDFAGARATTRFLPENFPDGWAPEPRALARVRALAAAFWMWGPGSGEAATPLHARTGFRVMGARRSARVELDVSDDYGTAKLALIRGPDGVSAEVEGETLPLTLPSGEGWVHEGLPVFAVRDGDTVHLAHDALAISAQVGLAIEIDSLAKVEGAGSGALTAPLPGLVTQVAVRPGDRVAQGATVLQMEAMKLVHTLAAHAAGTVAAVHCAEGDTVRAGALLVEITPDEEED